MGMSRLWQIGLGRGRDMMEFGYGCGCIGDGGRAGIGS